VGLRVHDRRKHSVDFNTTLAVGRQTGNKRHWNLEKVLDAHEEIRLKQVSEVNLNGWSAMAVQERTFKSIKCLRKQVVYRVLIDDMVQDSSEVTGERPETDCDCRSSTNDRDPGVDGGQTSPRKRAWLWLLSSVWMLLSCVSPNPGACSAADMGWHIEIVHDLRQRSEGNKTIPQGRGHLRLQRSASGQQRRFNILFCLFIVNCVYFWHIA